MGIIKFLGRLVRRLSKGKYSVINPVIKIPFLDDHERCVPRSPYGDISIRTYEYYAKELLRQAQPMLTFSRFGQHVSFLWEPELKDWGIWPEPMIKVRSKTITFRRYTV